MFIIQSKKRKMGKTQDCICKDSLKMPFLESEGTINSFHHPKSLYGFFWRSHILYWARMENFSYLDWMWLMTGLRFPMRWVVLETTEWKWVVHCSPWAFAPGLAPDVSGHIDFSCAWACLEAHMYTAEQCFTCLVGKWSNWNYIKCSSLPLKFVHAGNAKCFILISFSLD